MNLGLANYGLANYDPVRFDCGSWVLLQSGPSVCGFCLWFPFGCSLFKAAFRSRVTKTRDSEESRVEVMKRCSDAVFVRSFEWIRIPAAE